MKIRAIKLRVATDEGEYGFAFSFSGNLTVIRARNSSGKSTLFNTLLYALGMESLLGGRDERVLPYGVHDYFEYDGKRIVVVASEVLLEIENGVGKLVTLRRAIKHDQRQSKLVEVFDGPCLTGDAPLTQPKPTYLHDSGSAQRDEGFHKFLEQFLGIELPQVQTTSGGQVKLYIQTIFAALAVEQKRGWTDYIAGIPFYGIREARTRVAEYLLGLNVFEANAKRSELDAESVEINNDWIRLVKTIQQRVGEEGLVIEGLAARPDALFDSKSVALTKLIEGKTTSVSGYISNLREEYRELERQVNSHQKSTGESSMVAYEKTAHDLQQLSYLHEQAMTTLNLQRASLKEYEQLFQENREDYERNHTTQKLRNLGAELKLELASGKCPTCHQPLKDSLLGDVVSGPIMSLEENISYLKSQGNMLSKQISGTKLTIAQIESNVVNLARNVTEKQKHLNALRGDISNGAVESRAVLRRQLQIENEVERIEQIRKELENTAEELTALAKRVSKNQTARNGLPREKYSEADKAKINLFQKMFRANAGSFGYESAPIEEIQIHPDTLTPVLQEIELREISRKASDIAHNSSASDFVRLIWSYLLALYQTSSHSAVRGNHLGVLLFDEPGQHSMRAESQHALLRELAVLPGLQSIVAASFDENISVFEEATSGIDYQLIEWDGKIIRPFLLSTVE